jgi:hypothetical protein
VDGWIFEDNVERFLVWLARYVGYAYDHLDEQALVGALDTTDDESDCWFEYPLVGTPHVPVRLARSLDSSVVIVQVRGQLHDVLAARIDTLLNIYADGWSGARSTTPT